MTHDSLVYALSVAGVEPTEALVAELGPAYLRLTSAAEAQEALQALPGCTRAILSNGGHAILMLAALVQNSDLGGELEHVLSVGPARAFKPSPKAYALAERATGVSPQATMFASSNGFDVAAAFRLSGGPGAAWWRSWNESKHPPSTAGFSRR